MFIVMLPIIVYISDHYRHPNYRHPHDLTGTPMFTVMLSIIVYISDHYATLPYTHTNVHCNAIHHRAHF